MKRILLILIFSSFCNSSFSQDENRRSYSVSCQGITKKGMSCKNTTRCNNSLCHWHGGNCYTKKSTLKLPIKTVNNMKYISINISGHLFDFLIDTGASTMVIDSSLESLLLRAKKINKNQYQPKKYEIADGSKVVYNQTTISSIEIGGNVFKNVKVAIGDQNTSRLLGMSFLNQFKWEFKGNFLELKSK